MAAGLYNKRIEVLRRRSVPSDFGGFTHEWVSSGRIRARVVHRGGGVGVNAAEDFACVTLRFECYPHHDISHLSRIRYEGSLYAVQDLERDTRRNRLFITATRVNE